MSASVAAPANGPRSRAAAAVVRAVARPLGLFAAGFALTLVLVIVGGRTLGVQTFTVLSGSMEPAIATGDLVLGRTVQAREVRVGDVVSFRSPTDERLITHRVVGMQARGRSIAFMTMGDANTGHEEWAIPESGSVGRITARVPGLGHLANRAGSPLGRMLLIGLVPVLLGLSLLRHIWRTEEA